MGRYHVPLDLLADFIRAKFDEETSELHGFTVGSGYDAGVPTKHVVERDPGNVERKREERESRRRLIRIDPIERINSDALYERKMTEQYLEEKYELTEQDIRMGDRIEELVHLYKDQHADTLKQFWDDEDRVSFGNWLLERSKEHNDSCITELEMSSETLGDVEVKLQDMLDSQEYRHYLLRLERAQETIDLLGELKKVRGKIEAMSDKEKELKSKKSYAKAKKLREEIEQETSPILKRVNREYPAALKIYLDYENELFEQYIEKNEDSILVYIADLEEEVKAVEEPEEKSKKKKATKKHKKIESESEESDDEEPKKKKKKKKKTTKKPVKKVVVEESDEEEEEGGEYKFTEDELAPTLAPKTTINGIINKKDRKPRCQRCVQYQSTTLSWGSYSTLFYAGLMSDVFARTLGLPPVKGKYNYPELEYTAEQIDDPALHEAIKKYKKGMKEWENSQ